MDKKRVTWITGMKGFACLGVFWHHFLVGFFPAIYFGTDAVSHLKNNWDIKAAQSFFFFPLVGNFLVAIFCILSGIVIGLSVMKAKKKEDLVTILLKRYPRLMFPTAIVCVVVYIMMKLQLFYNVSASSYTGSGWLANQYVTSDNSVGAFIKLVFIDMWSIGDSTYSTAFWMLSQLFVGTFISIIFSLISYNTNMLGKVMLYGIGIPYFASQSNLGLAFVLGSLIAYAIYYDKVINNVFFKFLLLIVAVFMGGYPTYVIPDNYYSVFKYIHLEGNYQLIHIIGAFLLILVVLSSNLLKKIFSCKFLYLFGNISYAIYLWHIPILMSIGCYSFAKLQMNTGLTYV